jgi:hypothetical protein
VTGSALRWGLLSTASIGETVVRANRGSEIAEFVAVASRDAEKARRFADRLDLPVSFASYEELLASDSVDAVYVALPVSMHTEWTVKALQAGKHVLCEKPFAMSAADARRCVDAAEEAGVVCVEGLMYRHHPRTELARKLVAEGAIGEVTLVRGATASRYSLVRVRRELLLGEGVTGLLQSSVSGPGGQPGRLRTRYQAAAEAALTAARARPVAAGAAGRGCRSPLWGRRRGCGSRGRPRRRHCGWTAAVSAPASRRRW